MSNLSSRPPAIKIPRTLSEKIWDGIGLFVYFGSIIFLIYIWKNLPEKIPAHYNLSGEIDRWGSKWELLIMPILSIFSYGFITIFERFPESYNYPKRMNESNAPQFYLAARKMLNEVKNITIIIFSLIMIESITIALGIWKGLGIGLFWILIIAILIPIIKGIYVQRKIK